MVHISFDLTDGDGNQVNISMRNLEESEKLWLALGKNLVKLKSKKVRAFVDFYLKEHTLPAKPRVCEPKTDAPF